LSWLNSSGINNHFSHSSPERGARQGISFIEIDFIFFVAMTDESGQPSRHIPFSFF
jgi:hypothetical protein